MFRNSAPSRLWSRPQQTHQRVTEPSFDRFNPPIQGPSKVIKSFTQTDPHVRAWGFKKHVLRGIEERACPVPSILDPTFGGSGGPPNGWLRAQDVTATRRSEAAVHPASMACKGPGTWRPGDIEGVSGRDPRPSFRACPVSAIVWPESRSIRSRSPGLICHHTVPPPRAGPMPRTTIRLSLSRGRSQEAESHVVLRLTKARVLSYQLRVSVCGAAFPRFAKAKRGSEVPKFLPHGVTSNSIRRDTASL